MRDPLKRKFRAPSVGRQIKTELQGYGDTTRHLSLTVDEETRFALELGAMTNGQQLATYVRELALNAATSRKYTGKTFQEIWDSSAAVRWCRVFLWHGLALNSDAVDIKAFVMAHMPWFYTDKGEPDRKALAVLWPRIEEYAATWRGLRNTDPFKVAKQMSADLKKHHLPAPATE